MESIEIKAYAKINLGLDVLSRRPDGYHNVRMIMQTIRLHDKLEIGLTKSNGIYVKTNLSYLPNDKNNLVYRAAELFFKTTEISPQVYITLQKRIPVAAGLAGGSSDAAATLTALNELFDTGLSADHLRAMGVQLGADIPFCLLQGTALSEGIGEILTPLTPAPQCHCLIVKPPASVSTRYVYENLCLDHVVHPDIDAMLSAIQCGSLSGLCSLLGNVLESVTLQKPPEIAVIKEQMLSLGAMGALMSGSGPTVFGLFSDRSAAERAYYEFKVGEFGKTTYLTQFF